MTCMGDREFHSLHVSWRVGTFIKGDVVFESRPACRVDVFFKPVPTY